MKNVSFLYLHANRIIFALCIIQYLAESLIYSSSQWNSQEWELFLKRLFAIDIIQSDIYHHCSCFYVKGFGSSYLHQFMLYKQYMHDSEKAVITEQLRKAMGAFNFDRFVRIRNVDGRGLQVFFFGPAVDINPVMKSRLFFQAFVLYPC